MTEVVIRSHTTTLKTAAIHFVSGIEMRCDANVANCLLEQLVENRIEIIRIDNYVIFTRNIERISFDT